MNLLVLFGTLAMAAGLFIAIRMAITAAIRRELPALLHKAMATRDHVVRVERSLDWIAGQHCVSYLVDGRACSERVDLKSPCATCFARRAVAEDHAQTDAAFAAAH